MAVTQKYAAGKRAFGMCDRCGFRYDLSELKHEVWNKYPRNTRVCPTCWDPDHPQLHLGDTPFADPQTLREPRPDTAQAASRGLFSWKPVGNTSAMETAFELGRVTITIT